MVLEKVKAILASQFDEDEDNITPETRLQEDLNATLSTWWTSS